MSWSELERLVNDADGDDDLCRIMDSCKSQDELIVVATTLGYQINHWDVLQAWLNPRPDDLPVVSGG
ncbi:MAG: Nif11 family protein [Cyanobacteriota bacterium]|nr:Nif11 family protein [Cyanobacteriota bacterium]